MITFIQIFAVIFFLFALSRAILRFRDKSINVKELIFWCVVWVGAIVVAITPQVTVIFARLAGIGKGIDILLYVGFIVLFYLVFRLYVKLENLRKELTNLVREISIKEGKENKKRK